MTQTCPTCSVPGRLRLGDWTFLGALPLLSIMLCLQAAAEEVKIRTVVGMTTARRLPRTGAGVGGGAPVLANGSFADGLAGWSASESHGKTTPGSVSVASAASVLSEGDSFLVTLSQQFKVPSKARSLSFTVQFDPGFDTSDPCGRDQQARFTVESKDFRALPRRGCPGTGVT